MSERFGRLRQAARHLSEYVEVRPRDVGTVLSALDATEAEARENVARWMIAHSFSTGHGDTLVDLLDELSWQVREQLDRMLAAEARVKVLEEALRAARDTFSVEYQEDGVPASVSYGGDALRPLIALLDAALASKEEGGR